MNVSEKKKAQMYVKANANIFVKTQCRPPPNRGNYIHDLDSSQIVLHRNLANAPKKTSNPSLTKTDRVTHRTKDANVKASL